jgi:hypothetical protein
MASNDKFLQFPLCLLGVPVTGNAEEIGRDRMSAILHYAIVEHGRKVSADATLDELQELAAEIPEGDLPGGFDRNRRGHLEYVKGSKLLGVIRGGIPRAFDHHAQCTEYVGGQAARHGRDAVCRMRMDAVLEAMTGSMTWRDFSVLAAVFSVIGWKPFPVLVHRSMIRARGLGYKSPSVMQAELVGRNDVQPLTEKQIRLTLDSLESSGWFARVQASARKVYFSNRMTRDAVIAHLEKSATAQGRAINNRMRDRAVMARLAALKKGAEK